MEDTQNFSIPDGTVFHHRIASDLLKPNCFEVYRFAGILNSRTKSPEQNIKSLAEEAVDEVCKNMNCRSVYIRFPLTISETDDGKNNSELRQKKIQFADKEIISSSLAINLEK